MASRLKHSNSSGVWSGGFCVLPFSRLMSRNRRFISSFWLGPSSLGLFNPVTCGWWPSSLPRWSLQERSTRKRLAGASSRSRARLLSQQRFWRWPCSFQTCTASAAAQKLTFRSPVKGLSVFLNKWKRSRFKCEVALGAGLLVIAPQVTSWWIVRS